MTDMSQRFSRRKFMASTLLSAFFGGLQTRAALPLTGPTLPWRNWSGNQLSQPKSRVNPKTEDELIEFLKNSSGPIRPAGSGHSFSALVPTDGHLIVIDRLAGRIDHDADRLEANFGAGTRLGDMGPLLGSIGQAMFNLPDIDRQTLAGATATATHGTGIGFTNLSAYISGMRLISVSGEVIDLHEGDDRRADLFDAARVSLGALGLVTQIRLQNRLPYRLKAKSWVQKTEEVLEHFDESALSHRHFEMFPLTHSDYATVLAIDETEEPINNPPPTQEDEEFFGDFLSSVSMVPPGLRRDRKSVV